MFTFVCIREKRLNNGYIKFDMINQPSSLLNVLAAHHILDFSFYVTCLITTQITMITK